MFVPPVCLGWWLECRFDNTLLLVDSFDAASYSSYVCWHFAVFNAFCIVSPPNQYYIPHKNLRSAQIVFCTRYVRQGDSRHLSTEKDHPIRKWRFVQGFAKNGLRHLSQEFPGGCMYRVDPRCTSLFVQLLLVLLQAL